MTEYPWNKKNNTFTWLCSLYNPFKSRLCFTNTWKNRIKKGAHKNKGLVVSMLLILPDVIWHFKGPRMYKSNVNHKKS